MTIAGRGWMRTITMKRVAQTVVDGLVKQTEYDFTFRGTMQPLSPRAIALKPEGQRAWEWIQLHVFDGKILCDNDRVSYFGRLYKVMATLDYSQSNYIEYHLVRDFQAGAC